MQVEAPRPCHKPPTHPVVYISENLSCPEPLLPTRPWLRGAEFATGAWFIMMIVLTSMAGAGAFGLKIGMMAPIATLMLHWIYGAVLGGVFGGAPKPAAPQVAHTRIASLADAPDHAILSSRGFG